MDSDGFLSLRPTIARGYVKEGAVWLLHGADASPDFDFSAEKHYSVGVYVLDLRFRSDFTEIMADLTSLGMRCDQVIAVCVGGVPVEAELVLCRPEIVTLFQTLSSRLLVTHIPSFFHIEAEYLAILHSAIRGVSE